MSRFSRLLVGFPVLGRIDRWLGTFLTPVGKALFVATCFFLIGSFHLDTPVYLLFGAGGSLLLISSIAIRFFRPRLEYEVQLPSLVSPGYSFPLQLNAKNVGSRIACDVIVEPDRHDQDSLRLTGGKEGEFFDSIDVGEHVSLVANFTPMRRGVYSIPRFRMRSSFPMNLLYVSESASIQGEVVVAPEFTPLSRMESLSDAAQSFFGEHSVQLATGDDEFIGSREYFPGLPTRRWDHRTWARLGKPHICQFEQDSKSRVAMILDLSRCSNAETSEAAISLVVSIVDALQQRDVLVSSLTVGDHETKLGDTPSDQLNEVCDRLARIELDRVHDASPKVHVANEEPNGILVVAIDDSKTAKDQDGMIASIPNWLNICVTKDDRYRVDSFMSVHVRDIDRGTVVL